MKKLVLIDGSGFIFRAYHAIQRPLTRSDGTPVTAVYGFVTMILKLMQDMPADYMAVIFDAGRQTFRNRMYSEYKAHRPPPPDDLIPQFALVREATEALGLPSIELADYEADDLIATYTRVAQKQETEVVIVSSDKDLMQLIGQGVSMYDAMKGKPIGAEQVMEKFGVSPDKVRHVLALIGDSSDNIPGVPGIGPKTAAELINEHGDVETLLANLEKIKQPKRRDVLSQHAANARLSYHLIGLCETVPLPAPLESFAVRERDHAKLHAFLHAMEFKSLATRLEEKTGVKALPPLDATNATPVPAAMPTQYELVRDEAALMRWVNAARVAGYVAFDTETDSLDAMEAKLIGFSLCVEPGKACYVPLGHVEQMAGVQSQGNLFGEGTANASLEPVKGQIALQKALDIILPMLADPAVLIIGHNIKYDMLVMRKYGAAIISPLSDTMLLSYVLGAGLHNHNMDDTAQRHLGHKTISFNEVTGTGKARISFAEVSLEKALAYAAEDADITLRLWKKLTAQMIADHMVTVYETIERPLIAVLVAMEAHGIKVDKGRLAALSQDFTSRIAGLETEIFSLAGQSFNIGSPKQLGEILFEKMGYAGGKKGKTGSYSTDAAVLEDLAAEGHALPVKILEWRQLSKLKNTYTDALAQQINPRTGRVHTSFAMAVTSTGRLSSSDPNLQNIPIRTEEGRKIRHAFVAEPGHRLISADYSQIELRLLAHIADMPSLRQAFRNGEDIHALTASQMFGVALGEVNSDLRRKAKTINFGIIYGISAHGLAVRLGIPRGEAATYIDAYFRQYPGIREYMERTKLFAREHGYVTTLYGRKCFLPGINDKNPSMRAFSERAAINAPLQGTAADIIKRAMIAVERKLRDSPSRMLLQVHDELVIETPEADAEKIAAQVKQIMEYAAHLSVPLTADTRVGDNWHEAH